MAEISFTITFNIIECCNCHMQFAVTGQFQCEKRDDHTLFYCPRGHPQSYSAMSDLEKTKREKIEAENRLQSQLNEATHLRLVAERERDIEKRKLRKIESRIAKGVCPCCNRQFSDLYSHMKTKHKEYALPAGHQKQITGSVQ